MKTIGLFKQATRKILRIDHRFSSTMPNNLFIADPSIFDEEYANSDIKTTPEYYKGLEKPSFAQPIFDFKTGEQTERTFELSEKVFDTPIRPDLFHLVSRWQSALKRSGNAKVKTISERSGSGKKPHPQKGTGRARQGSTRAPHMRKGGRVHGPKPRDYSFKVNKKTRKLAIRSALSAKFLEQNLIIVEDFNVEYPELRDSFLGLGLEGKGVFAVSVSKDMGIRQCLSTWPAATRHVPSVGVNVKELLLCEKLVITEQALYDLQERLTKRKEYIVYE
eukprot:augustus_masked-scaffold_8-processed-gene-5.58-mRNA-1 protein AED:0.13 eAED:0.13 QI:0/-1/0/1/-1/1/1/0/276